MKKYFLLFLFCLLSCLSKSQTLSKEAIHLTQALNASWNSGDVGKAVPISLELFRISPESFVNTVHVSFAKKIDNPKAGLSALSYLKALMSQQHEGINRIVAPIYNWGRIKYSKDKSIILENFEDLKGLLADNPSYRTNRVERYCLFSLKELNGSWAVSLDDQQALLRQVVEKLESRYAELESISEEEGPFEERSWTRYLLAYSYHSLYKQVEANPEFLEKASFYSSDQNDILHSEGFVYDADILTRKTSSFEFKIAYFSYLQENKRYEEALDEMTSIAFLHPSDDNVGMLRSYYDKHSKAGMSFQDYWQAYIHEKGEPVPKISLRFSKYDHLDLKSKPGVWVYMDFWGTWCPPCVKELPELQQFYMENIRRGGVPQLKVYTLSFMSKNLSGFMKDHDYTFPVVEVERNVTNDFNVSSFPSKILISPEGNYIRIPHGVDWQTYVKNYTLM